jgi:tRNA 2-thiouridine synthesizing protein A
MSEYLLLLLPTPLKTSLHLKNCLKKIAEIIPYFRYTFKEATKATKMNNSEPNHTIDAKGLKCPMPVIKLQQQVRKSQAGELLAIECTDPSAEQDIASWAKVNKHLIKAVQHTDFGCVILLAIKESV